MIHRLTRRYNLLPPNDYFTATSRSAAVQLENNRSLPRRVGVATRAVPAGRAGGSGGSYLVLLLHLHAVLGPWLYLRDFLSEEEAQASHECVCCLIYGWRGSQLLLGIT